LDESDNMILKKLAQQAHASIFARRVLATWRAKDARKKLRRGAFFLS
jgi:hypothetical protein